MPRVPPQVEVVKLNGNELSLKLKPLKPTTGLSWQKRSLLHTYTKYKNVVKAGDSNFYAYTTVKGKKVYTGTHPTAVAAAIAIAEVDKDVREGVADVVIVGPKVPVVCPVMSPLHGIDDKEASRLASPVSIPPSPLEPCNIFASANLKGRAAHNHKTLLQSWQEDHGSPFQPTANASTMRIPFSI
jgi:hypothetical protein